MWILGISAFYHDAAAVLLKDGEVVAAIQEERFTRVKHDASFPRNAVAWCLDFSGLSPDRIDVVAFYEKPFLKFERLLETYYAFAPRGIRSFGTAMPVWLKEKMFIKGILKKELKKITGSVLPKTVRIIFPEHHLSHAASAFFPSPFEDAAILTIDGVGEWSTSTIGRGIGNGISLLREIEFPHSMGLLYSAFTYYTGFKVNSGEYKLMGLAPYGDAASGRTKKFVSLITNVLVDIKEDGSLRLNMDYFDFATGIRMVNDRKWHRLFGVPRRKPESELTQEYMDMAFAIQQVTEDVVFRMARHARDITGSKRLVMAGGVSFNCVANGKLLRSGLFEDIWIQPASGDAGGAMGAALSAWHMYLGKGRTLGATDSLRGSYLGPSYSGEEIEHVARCYDAPYEFFDDFGELAATVAKLISEGRVTGWFQGRTEWGPRALGNRSIIADPRNEEMQRKLNLKIKFRESFRPFAPAVLFEDVGDYFETTTPSPYMLLVADVVSTRRKELPVSFNGLSPLERMNTPRSDIPAVTHLDWSARLQTVHAETNPRFHGLLRAFRELTGCGILINTSFNVRGEPIVLSPEHAYICFMRTGMDCLVMGDYLFRKEAQKPWHEEKNWKEEYELD